MIMPQELRKQYANIGVIPSVVEGSGEKGQCDSFLRFLDALRLLGMTVVLLYLFQN